MRLSIKYNFNIFIAKFFSLSKILLGIKSGGSPVFLIGGKMKRTSIYVEILVFYLVFLVLALTVRGAGSLPDWLDHVLSVATFVFAVILAFSTANRKERLNSIRSLLRKDDSLLFIIYQSARLYGSKVASDVREIIDKWLVSQIDYFLVDFEKTNSGLKDLTRYCFELEVSQDEDTEPKKSMVDACKGLMANQKEIIFWLKDGMRLFEWISLAVLGSIIVFCLYYLKNPSLAYIVVVPFVSTSLVLLFLVLRDLNNLSWQEDRWIWNRLVELFGDLDLLPYFPNDIFESRRIRKEDLDLPEKYRIAIYHAPYPNVSAKDVLVVSRQKAALEKVKSRV